jgi:hypothetical protein
MPPGSCAFRRRDMAVRSGSSFSRVGRKGSIDHPDHQGWPALIVSETAGLGTPTASGKGYRNSQKYACLVCAPGSFGEAKFASSPSIRRSF